ncbi:hypothetical protein B0H13DRAFT_2504515 [Mycena leptocephala]|nr:hypothetical protein B0H13DRAFT_2504515 [Mycena leptocephala]
MRPSWQPMQYPKNPLSTARPPRILRMVLHIAWARRRCTIIASPLLNDEPAPYLHALRRCACASCNRDCRLSMLARASDAHATAPTPSRAPAHAFAVTRPHFILGCVPPFHFAHRFARQLPERVPSHPYAITNSFCSTIYSAVLTSSIKVLQIYSSSASRGLHSPVFR